MSSTSSSSSSSSAEPFGSPPPLSQDVLDVLSPHGNLPEHLLVVKDEDGEAQGSVQSPA